MGQVASITTRIRTKLPLPRFQINYGNRISTILPKEKSNNKVGRPAILFRKVLNGIVFVLRTKGCQ
jgi:hypothetical protein